MGMPSFYGSLVEAEQSGLRCLKCHWCSGWCWWPPENELTEQTRRAGRVFHCWGDCQVQEQAARAKESA